MVESVVYRGERFRVQTSGRYYQSGRKDVAERLLHRRVWRDHHGAIPDGYHIHHKDGDWRNNAIENLALVDGIDHWRQHKLQQLATPGASERNVTYLARARIAAAEWHRSDKGLAFHSELGRDSWKNRPPKLVQCQQCGKSFTARRHEVALFCSRACYDKSGRGGYLTCFTDVRNCAWCGKEFVAHRYRKVACCSRLCGNRKRVADARLQSDP